MSCKATRTAIGGAREGIGSEQRYFFFFQAEDGIRDVAVTGVQTCALPISRAPPRSGCKSLPICTTAFTLANSWPFTTNVTLETWPKRLNLHNWPSPNFCARDRKSVV